MYRLLVLAATGFALILASTSGPACAEEFNDLAVVEMERQLNLILKTRRVEEKAYIAVISKLVKEKKLPRKLINTSFKYVRNKHPYTRYPFVYFVRVLQFQAKRDKLKVPKFDFSVYTKRAERS